MDKRKYLILFICLYLLSGIIHAQNTSVMIGMVYEMTDDGKQPVPGANVVVMNDQNRFIAGSPTNYDGEYIIQIPQTSEKLQIVVSFIGLKTQTVDYNNQQVLDFVLKPDSKEMEEVVVAARHIDQVTGITKEQQTNATQRISMDEIMAVSPVASIDEALQGKLGGVDIISGGDPGARSSIRIRGTSTLNGSAEPLIVIDGIPYPTDIDDDFNFSTANEEDYGQLLNIAPSDIEAIEVLKDAAATAIWGTSGGNGVLVITTKKGSKGKTRFSFSTKSSVKFEPDPIPMLDGDEYVALMQEAIWNTAMAQGLQNSSSLLNLLFDTPEINYNPSWRYFDEYNVNTDWVDEIKRTATTSDNSFSMTGGGDKATYRFSLNYLNEQGTTMGTNYDRLTSKLNIYYNFSRKLRVSSDFAYTAGMREANYENGSSWRNARSEAMAKMPNKSPFWIDDETGERTNEYFSRQNIEEFQGSFTGSRNYNPVALVNEGYKNIWSKEAKITFRLEYHFTDALKYTGWASMLMGTTKTKQFLPQVATGVTGLSIYNNMSTDALSDKFVLQTENKLLYNKNWNDTHNLVATTILRTYQQESSNYSSLTSGSASAGLSDPITGGTVLTAGSGFGEKRTLAMIGNAHYSLLEKYMIQAGFSYEGNSNLGKSERYGFFPSIGVGWHLNKEEFMRQFTWLDMAKIRASYGQSGSAPGSGTAAYVGTFEALGESYIDIAAIAPVSVQLNNLKWESSTEYDAGFDLETMNSKLNFTFDWYQKITDDLLQRNYKVPSSTGYPKIDFYNSGSMMNYGLEFRVDYNFLKTKNWDLSVNANVNRNINKILTLPSQYTEEFYTFGNGNYAQILETGVPVGSFYGYKYLGVYQNNDETFARDAEGKIMNDIEGNPVIMQNGGIAVAPGDAKYDDRNHDGVINKYDIEYIGNGMPVLTGGGGFAAGYKNLRLTVFFHGRAGQKVINSARMSSEAMHGTNNQSKATLSRWRNEGDDTDIPRALYNYGYNYLGSDRFVENCSYLRLKTLSLSYNLPRNLCKKWGINSLNVFATLYDMFTWTKYTGQDPEVSLPSSPTKLVTDGANTPVSRRMACGITINF